ncbi:hypothetical protein JCM17960_18080 [Magnetospira thiophila]
MAKISHEDAVDRRRIRNMIWGALGLLTAVAVIGVFFAYRFVDSERVRAQQEWQVRLGIVADSRAAAVAEWVESNFTVIRELATNESLQLYISELAMADWDRLAVTDEAAQAGYMLNLLVATAEREGFSSPPSLAAETSNVGQPGMAGMALIAATGDALAVTPGMPAFDEPLIAAFHQALSGKPTLIDMFPSQAGPVTMGFALPVYGLQDDPDGKGIGVVMGVRVVDEGLFKRLKQPGEIAKTAESYLVRADGNTVTYLSPLADGTAPLKLSLALDTPKLGAAFGLQTPGGFLVGRDYSGAEALITARAIADTPWTLIRKVSREEALAQVEERLNTIFTVFILLIVGILITIVAVWRHGTSVRAAQAATRFKIAAERFENMVKFMRVVTDSQPTEIMAVDAEGRFTFANKTAADVAGMKPEDMLGKTMTSVYGPIKAGTYAEINGRVIESFTPERALRTFHDQDGQPYWYRSAHVPLRGDRDYPPASLTILDDITDLTLETERSKRRLMQLVDTLVGVVDRRDPFSAHHSSRVAEVARAVAGEMGLDEITQSTADLAGRLMNLGKIFIPTDLLTKTGQLSPEERDLLANSVEVSAEMIEKVEFEGPVVDTLRQIGESWDGSGPRGLSGESIVLPARIVAVANTFVGMLSPRAYREAFTFEKVESILIEEADKKFDRKAVLALVHYLENRDGRETWAHFRAAPEG